METRRAHSVPVAWSEETGYQRRVDFLSQRIAASGITLSPRSSRARCAVETMTANEARRRIVSDFRTFVARCPRSRVRVTVLPRVASAFHTIAWPRDLLEKLVSKIDPQET